MLRALSAVPVAAGLAAGALLIGEDAGAPLDVLAFVLSPLGFIGIAIAYSRGRFPEYPIYGGVVVLTAGAVGGIWQEGRDVDLNTFWVGFIFFGGWALGSVVVGGLGLVGWRHVNRARGGRR